MAVIREKEVMKNILERYKELPCLWKHSHELYNNKIARKEGLTELLDMYKLVDPDARLTDVKKKIENCRTTYRRERAKVVRSEITNGPVYVPTLWYYDILRFLDEVFYGATPEPQSRKSSDYTEEEKLDEEERLDEEEEEFSFKTENYCNSPPPAKKKKRNSNLIFLTEDAHELDQGPYSICQDQGKNNLEQTSSAESFGRTVGLQLGELPPMQRFIAEKLVSDVIFYGRLEKLNPKTTLKFVNDDDY